MPDFEKMAREIARRLGEPAEPGRSESWFIWEETVVGPKIAQALRDTHNAALEAALKVVEAHIVSHRASNRRFGDALDMHADAIRALKVEKP